MRSRHLHVRTGLSLVEVVVALFLVGVTATAAAALLIATQRADRWRDSRDAQRAAESDSVARQRATCDAVAAPAYLACRDATDAVP